MSLERKIAQRRQRRTQRTRDHLHGTVQLSVFRSLKYTYAQIIDTSRGETLVSSSSFQLKAEGDKVSAAYKVGQDVAQKALDKGISSVVLDRGPYLYHGRVAAVAQGAREKGLQL